MKYAFKRARRVRLYDLGTEKHMATLSDLQKGQFTGDQETVYAEGTDGAKLAAFDMKKVAAFNATNGAIDTGYLALQVGSKELKITNGSELKIRAELVTKDGATVLMPHTPFGTVGNEIGYIYSADVNGMPDKDYAQAASASTTEFAYAPASKEITLPTGVFAKGATVIVDYYPTFKTYTRIDNDADKFALSARVIVDAWFTDLCTEKDVPLMVVMEKGKISGAIDLSFGDQVSVQNIAIESMASSCAGGSNGLWRLYNYDEEEIVDS